MMPEFLEKYGDYISASELGGSKLWDNIIEHRIKAIKKENSVLNYYFRYRYTTIVKGKLCIWL